MFDFPSEYNMNRAEYQAFQRELYSEEYDLSLPHRRDAIVDDPDDSDDSDE